jgi:hypothetical protein
MWRQRVSETTKCESIAMATAGVPAILAFFEVPGRPPGADYERATVFRGLPAQAEMRASSFRSGRGE